VPYPVKFTLFVSSSQSWDLRAIAIGGLVSRSPQATLVGHTRGEEELADEGQRARERGERKRRSEISKVTIF
jgi:hypothetical protein